MFTYLSIDYVLGSERNDNYPYPADDKTLTSITPSASIMILIGTYTSISKEKVFAEKLI